MESVIKELDNLKIKIIDFKKNNIEKIDKVILGQEYEKTDIIKAKQIYKEAMDEGDILGKICYVKILIKEKNFEEAYNTLIHNLIKDNSYKLYYLLALLYVNGFYVKKDLIKAINLLKVHDNLESINQLSNYNDFF
jgi:TPR repeat protein